MRPSIPLLLAVSTVAAGVTIAPAANAAAHTTAARRATANFTCADGIAPQVLPPQIIAWDCKPPTPGSFQNVKISFPDGAVWSCEVAEARPGKPGFVDVRGDICEHSQN